MTPNYIFDFGKVLVDFDPIYMTSQYVEDSDDIQLVSEVIFDRLYWDKLDYNAITVEEVKTEIRKRLPERLWQNAEKAYDNWYRHLPEINGMRPLLHRLKNDGYRLFLLSNIGLDFVQNYSTVPALSELFSIFDGLVFSAPLGIIKPNPEIFYYLLKTYDLKPEECTFIDDSIKNITGAQNIGIHTIQFHGDYRTLENTIFTN